MATFDVFRRQLKPLVDGELRAVGTAGPGGGSTKGMLGMVAGALVPGGAFIDGVVDSVVADVIQTQHARRTVEVRLTRAMCFALTDTELSFYKLGGMLDTKVAGPLTALTAADVDSIATKPDKGLTNVHWTITLVSGARVELESQVWAPGAKENREALAAVCAWAIANAGVEAAAAPADADHPLAQLERLSALHERGVLTAEEFAAQKAKLLERI